MHGRKLISGMEKRIYIFILFVLFSSIDKESRAATVGYVVLPDTAVNVKIHFDLNSALLCMSCPVNEETLRLLDALVPDACFQSLTLASFTSPFVDVDIASSSLIAERMAKVRTYLMERYPSLRPEEIRTDITGRSWDKLRQMTVEDAQLPNRGEVLILMDYHKDNYQKLAELLRKLDGGKSHRYILERLLPELQQVDVRVSSRTSDLNAAIDERMSSISALTSPGAGAVQTGAIEPVEMSPSATESGTVLAVKTNLLYDLMLAPNVEVEIPIGKAWSVNTEYVFPWWVNNPKEFCYQLLSGGIEGRYWLGKRDQQDRLTGHFVGVYGSGGIYDFQFRGDGCQGDYFVASGVSYGYGKSIGRNLSLEFSLGVGYLVTNYRKYTPYEGSLVWKSAGRYHFFGPTKAKISLVWHIKSRR